MARMAGDVADGLIGHPIQSLRWIDEVVVDAFEEGLSRSGRERKDFDYLPTVCCAIDDDEARAIEMARRTISFYATVKTYMPLWELHGFADNAVAAGEAFRRGDLAAVPAAISDEMVETYCAAGPLDKVRARVEATAERADGLFLTPPTYFISPEELSEYQNRIIDAFGPAALTAAPGESRAARSARLACARSRAGFVRTYGDVSPGAPRFAGAVLFEVDEPDLPWWRVVRADGSLAKGAPAAASAASLDRARASRRSAVASGVDMRLVRPGHRPEPVAQAVACAGGPRGV